MKLITKLVILVFAALPYCAVHSQERAMTFNIRYSNPDDGENWWEQRKDDVVKLIENYRPDFMGTQEGLLEQLSFIDAALPSYKFVGVGRDDGQEKGEFTALFFNTKKYDLVKTETFWLSETPEKVSVGWDASMERICTYAVFKNSTTEDIYHIFNAHFDHIGETARAMSAKVIQQKINALNINEEPILVMGDFNSTENQEPIQIFLRFLEDPLANSVTRLLGPKGTFNGFDPHVVPENRIDYIFTKNIKEVKSYAHINDKRPNGLCVSDHLPVLLEFETH